MKTKLIIVMLLTGLTSIAQDFSITDVRVEEDKTLKQLVFKIEVEGMAGDSVPTAIGDLDGAPVLGYVIPTTLISTDVGFGTTDGIVALALTSHPDFDDTPLWDENLDSDYANDGVVWHAHWVMLEPNLDVPGGLAVKATDEFSILPPTNPGMPMYMDSPGFSVVWDEHVISCIVPLTRLNNQSDFNYDGVTALMNVNTSDPDLPMLGVYEVYSIASGDLSLPYSVGNYTCDTLIIDVSSEGGLGLIDPLTVKVYPNPASTQVTLEMSVDFDFTAFEVQITNLIGEEVFIMDLNSPVQTIPVADIGADGIYILNILDKDTEEIKGSKKLVLN
ncbi:MAG: T9SS type A sorting domain-containing protein [Crocinitomix sp.]|nr:T9SS type A sorting domain-containing protein [Crocinitomix sp.]